MPCGVAEKTASWNIYRNVRVTLGNHHVFVLPNDIGANPSRSIRAAWTPLDCSFDCCFKTCQEGHKLRMGILSAVMFLPMSLASLVMPIG